MAEQATTMTTTTTVRRDDPVFLRSGSPGDILRLGGRRAEQPSPDLEEGAPPPPPVAAACPTVLLIEDSRTDVRLIEEAFKELQVELRLLVAHDAHDAREYLRAVQERAESRPDLVILDLSLPDADGLDLLREIRAAEGLRSLPVVVLSGSADLQVVRESYEVSANSFVTKPLDPDGFVLTAQAIKEFWLGQARLPED